MPRASIRVVQHSRAPQNAAETVRTTTEREEMIQTQLVAREISSPRVLDAFRAVPREKFVPDAYADQAYSDLSLPIAFGQTISQPYIVALTVDALDVGECERVLEIGTGSGYEAAILAQLAAHVFTVERLEGLAELARERLEGYSNVTVHCGDGTLGWPQHAPFDAIAVSAGGPTIPRALLSQLVDGGRLVIPVGAHKGAQWLMRVTRHGNTYRHQSLGPVRFVPLIGKQGWPEDDDSSSSRG